MPPRQNNKKTHLTVEVPRDSPRTGIYHHPPEEQYNRLLLEANNQARRGNSIKAKALYSEAKTLKKNTIETRRFVFLRTKVAQPDKTAPNKGIFNFSAGIQENARIGDQHKRASASQRIPHEELDRQKRASQKHNAKQDKVIRQFLKLAMEEKEDDGYVSEQKQPQRMPPHEEKVTPKKLSRLGTLLNVFRSKKPPQPPVDDGYGNYGQQQQNQQPRKSRGFFNRV